MLPVHPGNSSCVTNLGHYNSFITTPETDIVNILFTGSVLEHTSETLGAHANKCFDVCLSNLGYCFLLHQGTKSWAQIGPEPQLRKNWICYFSVFPAKRMKNPLRKWKYPKLRFPTSDLSKTHPGSMYLFHFRFQPHDPSFLRPVIVFGFWFPALLELLLVGNLYLPAYHRFNWPGQQTC